MLLARRVKIGECIVLEGVAPQNLSIIHMLYSDILFWMNEITQLVEEHV